MRRWIAIVCPMLSMVVAGVGAQPRTLVLDGGTLIDGTGRRPLANAVIVIEGSRILRVGLLLQGKAPRMSQLLEWVIRG